MSTIKIILLSVLMASAYFFASDMYAPSLPSMAKALQISATTAQQTVTDFLIAFSLIQIFIGPLSERFGRRHIAILSSLLFFIGAIFCLLSYNLNMLIIGRILQGFAAGSLFLLARVIMQDSFDKEKLTSLLTWTGILFMTLPALTPTLGGFLEHYYGWKGSFFFMVLQSILIFILLVSFLKETNLNKNMDAHKPKKIFNDYKQIIKNFTFLTYTLFAVISVSGILVFYLMGSFIAIQTFHISPKIYGLSSLILISSSISGRFFTLNFLKKKFSEYYCFFIAFFILILGSLLMFIASYLASYELVLFSIIIFAFGSGCVLSMAPVGALYVFPSLKGQAAAMYGSLQMLGVFVITFIATHLTNSIEMMATLLSCISILGLIVLTMHKLPKKIRH